MSHFKSIIHQIQFLVVVVVVVVVVDLCSASRSTSNALLVRVHCEKMSLQSRSEAVVTPGVSVRLSVYVLDGVWHSRGDVAPIIKRDGEKWRAARTWARCRFPGAWRHRAQTRDCWGSWSRWWRSARSRGPRSATRADWTDSRGTRRNWRRGTIARCTARCSDPAGPWTRRLPASASLASWSWCWCRAAWTACWSRRRALVLTWLSAVLWRGRPPANRYAVADRNERKTKMPCCMSTSCQQILRYIAKFIVIFVPMHFAEHVLTDTVAHSTSRHACCL